MSRRSLFSAYQAEALRPLRTLEQAMTARTGKDRHDELMGELQKAIRDGNPKMIEQRLDELERQISALPKMAREVTANKREGF